MSDFGLALSSAPGRVIVVGSVNTDMAVEVVRRPHGGETLTGSDLHVNTGGKGANQAAAAGRAGAAVSLIACVGDDLNADLAVRDLRDAGVDTDLIVTTPGPSGSALILLTPDGENSIVVSPGANRRLTTDAVAAASAGWSRADLVVVSLEIPLPVVDFVAAEGARAGARVIVNAAPAAALRTETLAVCDPLVVNQHEAMILLGQADAGDAVDYSTLALQLLDAGARSCIITLGSAGSVIADASRAPVVVPAYSVDVVDTTGAGDAFVGALASELASGASLDVAARFATAMSALAVQSAGAMSSYPSRAEVERQLAGSELATP